MRCSSMLDRIRYYWGHPDVKAALARLHANLGRRCFRPASGSAARPRCRPGGRRRRGAREPGGVHPAPDPESAAALSRRLPVRRAWWRG
ncbi:MAG: class II D-tagatose-bisphosphate aldolase, non-catalytic subunit [Desulfobacterales bacterium]|nr:class II D-tagatose-bisphosphate aldolase, non-catalytic subunit [Desulfobacterales bacterium]